MREWLTDEEEKEDSLDEPLLWLEACIIFLVMVLAAVMAVRSLMLS